MLHLVADCPACGKRHDFAATKFKRNRVDPAPFAQQYYAWSFCAEVGEPIYFVDDDVTYVPMKPRPSEIASLAHALWEMGGCKHGFDVEYWLLAEACLTRWWLLPSPKSFQTELMKCAWRDLDRSIFASFRDKHNRFLDAQVLGYLGLSPEAIAERVARDEHLERMRADWSCQL